MVSDIKTLQVWDTNFCADSAEWCPIHPYENLFVCGTYQLQENKDEMKQDASQIKIGILYLMEFNESSELLLKQSIEMPAILDSKWCCKKLGNKILLGVVNSKAEVLVYELLVDSLGSKLSLITRSTICEQSDVLALSLDWSAEQSSLTVSDSKGNVSLLLFQDSKLDIKLQWNAHTYEAWITAFDYWKPNVIYTGGDDCLFHMFDIRCSPNKPSATSKAHNMGVTSLHCSVSEENIIASGSYDESLRLWDVRQLRHPTTSFPLGGGVWRIKWHPRLNDYILAACMHFGSCVVKVNSGIVATYKEHSSMVYGADWSHKSSQQEQLLATCSFYDHKLCISSLILEKDV